MPIVIESSHEFAERHSAKGQPVVVNNRLVFPDGATCSLGYADVRAEPGENIFERCQVQIEYWRRRLADATTDFQQLKFALSGRGATMHRSHFKTSGSPVAGDQTGLETLRYLRDCVKEIRTKLAAIEGELTETAEHRAIERREKVREEIREIQEQQDAEIRAEAVAINLD